MSLEDLRRRIGELNRAPLPSDGSPKTTPIGPNEAERPSTPTSTALSRVVDGVDLEAGAGRCYCVRRGLSACWTDPLLGCSFADGLRTASANLDGLDRDLTPLVTTGARRLLFMDLETCGFAGTPVFLIGLAWSDGRELHVEQLFARNYEEEAAIIARFAALYRDRPLLVSFNGKTFDWPVLRDRAAVWRVALQEPAAHCDLLHVGRRRYRALVPDCRLQTLELYVCKRGRSGDIPGGEIPAAYHHYVRSGDARRMRDVIHHNFLDLVTMVELVVDLLRAPRPRSE